MKTTNSDSTEFSGKILSKKVLLIFGILSSLLYVSADILAAIKWEDYSYTSQSVSELMAIGAPTRPLIILLFSIYNVLVIAFGLGIWGTDTKKRSLRITGVLLVGYGIMGFVGLLVFPMHLRGTEKTITDTMHIIITCVIVLLILLSIGFGSVTDGKPFLIYSIATIVVLLLFGIFAGMDGPRVDVQLPTPLLGIKERINIYTFLLWVMFLAIILLRPEKEIKSH